MLTLGVDKAVEGGDQQVHVADGEATLKQRGRVHVVHAAVQREPGLSLILYQKPLQTIRVSVSN